VSAVIAWEFHRDRLADSLRLLRQRHQDATDYDRILADRAAASLEALDALLEPSAGELVRAGWTTDDALARVDQHVTQLRQRMGGKP
jgi:hypothetical protein